METKNKYQIEAQENLDNIKSILKQNQLSFQDIINLYDLIAYNKFLEKDIFISITQQQISFDVYEPLLYLKIAYFGKEAIYKFNDKLKDSNFYELVKTEFLFYFEDNQLKTTTQTIPYNFDTKISKIEFISLFYKHIDSNYIKSNNTYNNKVKALESKEKEYNKFSTYCVYISDEYVYRRECIFFPNKIFEHLKVKAGLFMVYKLKPGYENYTETQIKEYILEKLCLIPIKELKIAIKNLEIKLEKFKKQLDIISANYSEYVI